MPLGRATRLTLVGLVAVGTLTTGASAATPLGEQVRATVHGPPNDASVDAMDAAVAHNSLDNEFLLVWEGDVAGMLGKTEIYGRLLNADGTPKGDQFPISATPGDALQRAARPDVIFDPEHEVYAVVWEDRRGVTPRGDILGQRVMRDGTVPGDSPRNLTNLNSQPTDSVLAENPALAWNPETGHTLLAWSDDRPAQGGFEIHVTDFVAQPPNMFGPPPPLRVSDMGGNTNGYSATRPDIAYDALTKQFLIVWQGDDNTAPLVNNELEIFGQRVKIGPDPATPGQQVFTEIGADTRISDMGPDGNTAYVALNPRVAADAAGGFLIVWEGDDANTPLPPAEPEIYGRRVDFTDPDGISVLGEDARYSDMGPDGDGNYRAQNPHVTANPAAREYLVTWDGDDDTPPLANNEEEVFAQRVAADGSEVESDTVVSDMGPVIGSVFYRAARPTAAYNPVTDRYLVAWEGDDDSVGDGQNGVDDEFELWTRQVAGAPATLPPGTPPGGGVPGTTGAPSAANCATTPDISGAGATGTLTLSITQLRINQRIGQAAVRRANALNGWLGDGIVGADLCGGSLAPEQLDAGIVTASGVLGPVPTTAGPRPLVIPAAADKGTVRFRLTTAQLRTNQRVYSAAVRRANALMARIDGGLTGGDIRDGSVGRDRLRQDLTITARTPAASTAPASVTPIVAADSDPATFRLTVGQLRTNQRIAQAAVRRTNELRALLETGLRGENFTAGSISAVDLAP